MRGGGHQDTANGELESKTNTDTDETWLFQYDVLGNLLSVGLPNGDLVEYLVDGMGRRVGKKKNGVLLKQWLYRDALKPAAELDGAGNLVAQFVYGSKSNVPDYVRRGGTTYRVISDHLGSPRYVVNVANANDVPFTASYSAFGEVSGNGLDWMPFGYAGGSYDLDTGLIRFGARDYEPMIGRWTRKEPLRFSVTTGFYVYASNDPINRSDPSGKFDLCHTVVKRVCPIVTKGTPVGAWSACFLAEVLICDTFPMDTMEYEEPDGYCSYEQQSSGQCACMESGFGQCEPEPWDEPVCTEPACTEPPPEESRCF